MFNLKKNIYNLGVRLRNPSYQSAYESLKLSENFCTGELQDIQRRKLVELLKFAMEYSQFYKSKFTNVDFNSDVNPYHILAKLPVLTKSDLINFNNQIHTTRNFEFKKLFFSETSGSSGEPLTFYKDEKWDSSNRASIARGLSWYGVEPWQYNGYFWGYSFSFFARLKVRLFDRLLNRFRLFSYGDKDIDNFVLKAKKAIYLHGYSSMIYEVAKRLNYSGCRLSNLKFVKGTSEKIYEHYQPEAMKAFGCKIVSEYGAAETGIIAFECPDGKMHINEETCIVEVIDDHILVTNLEAYSFPIIRYALGDYVKLSDEVCTCGRSHRVIEEVLGRVGKNIYGNGNRIFPSLTLYYIFKILALEYSIQLNYKAEQYVFGELVIKIDRKLNAKEIQLINSISNTYFEYSVSIIIKDDIAIHDKSKKLKDFESFL